MIDNSSNPHWRSPYADILIQRLTQPRRFMQVMSGPRQVGKTTMVLRVAKVSGKPHHYATADSPTLRGSAWIAQQWNAARALARQGEKVCLRARRRSSSPKLQPLDPGLVTASSGISLNSWAEPGDPRHRLVECAVGAHLCNWAFSSGRQDIFYWRDRNYEVDFVVPFQGKLFAIEVKSSQTRPRGLPGTERFMQRYPSATPLLVGGGIPLADFLSRPVDDWLNQ